MIAERASEFHRDRREQNVDHTTAAPLVLKTRGLDSVSEKDLREKHDSGYSATENKCVIKNRRFEKLD